MQKSRNTYTHIQQNIFALKALFTSSNCIFMQLQGIVFIQRHGNDIFANCKEINSFKGHIVIHKKYNHSRQLYSFTESYSYQGTYQFILRNISMFKENMFIH